MIRKITNLDYDIFMDLGNDFYNSNAVEEKIPKAIIKQTFEHIIKDSPYIKGFLIYVDNDIAGFFTISFAFATEFGGKIMLFEDLYIKSKYQGNGLGTEIFSYVEEKYNDDVEVIKLEVSRNNKRALELYEKLGYSKNKYVSMIKKV